MKLLFIVIFTISFSQAYLNCVEGDSSERSMELAAADHVKLKISNSVSWVNPATGRKVLTNCEKMVNKESCDKKSVNLALGKAGDNDMNIVRVHFSARNNVSGDYIGCQAYKFETLVVPNEEVFEQRDY